MFMILFSIMYFSSKFYFNRYKIIDSFNNSTNSSRSFIHKTIFFCKRPPKLDLKSYLGRITNYTVIEKSTLILCLLYIDRLCNNNGMKLNENNIHK